MTPELHLDYTTLKGLPQEKCVSIALSLQNLKAHLVVSQQNKTISPTDIFKIFLGDGSVQVIYTVPVS